LLSPRTQRRANETAWKDLRNLQAKFHELERLARDLLDARPRDDDNDSIPPSSPRFTTNKGEEGGTEEEVRRPENGDNLHFAEETNLDASPSPATDHR